MTDEKGDRLTGLVQKDGLPETSVLIARMSQQQRDAILNRMPKAGR